MSILQNIQGHEDLIRLNDAQREQLCEEIRSFLVESISKTGGHLASNLGVVELTVAIETVYNTMEDRLVFDVGHQSYVHKLLTGRRADFATLRRFGGMAGFPKPGENAADAFVAGHASSSISIALGMARARSLSGEKYNVAALVGDGAATGGMAYEGLNDAAVSKEPLVIVLNDNEMSIDRNVGGMARHLSALRTKESYLGMKQKYKNFLAGLPGGQWAYRLTRNIKDRVRRALIPNTFFESIGMTYLGPVDGHDVNGLIALLRIAKNMHRPVVVHVMTQKGRGYHFAEENPSHYHGVGAFDPNEGIPVVEASDTFSEAFGKTMCELAESSAVVCGITAAMPAGTGLLEFKNRYPSRFFDVGIAEEHAVSMAAGLAKQGMIPVTAIYSTFLQRSFDMLLQDIAILRLHAIFAVDRAGLVGEDGETHHGVFDVGFLRQIPHMKLLCPVSCKELHDMLLWAVTEQKGPVAIRYPRGKDRCYSESDWLGISNTVKCHRRGTDVMIITYGTMLDNAMQAAQILARRGVETTVLRLMELSSIPVDEICKYLSNDTPVVVVEEICAGSGIRESLAWELRHLRRNSRIEGIDLGKNFVTHGTITELYRHHGLDAQGISDFVLEVIRFEN